MCNDRRITLNDTPKALLEIWIAIKKLSKRLKKGGCKYATVAASLKRILRSELASHSTADQLGEPNTNPHFSRGYWQRPPFMA